MLKRIILLTSIFNEANFHFLRENKTKFGAIWSHKLGATMVINRDNKNRIITDPVGADFDRYKIRRFFHVPVNGIKTKPLKVTPIQLMR